MKTACSIILQIPSLMSIFLPSMKKVQDFLEPSDPNLDSLLFDQSYSDLLVDHGQILSGQEKNPGLESTSTSGKNITNGQIWAKKYFLEGSSKSQ